MLTNAQEGKTKALRQWRFDTIEDIDQVLVTNYVDEAIDNKKKGRVVKPAKATIHKVPSEFTLFLKRDRALQKSFSELTPYKQKEYAEFIAEAKRDSTKEVRFIKIRPMIISGKGLNDKYR